MRKLILATVFIYTLGYGIILLDKSTCLGWDCDTVYCPTGYAVYVPDHGYLPCDQFDEFIDGNKEVIRNIIKKETDNEH